MYIDDTYGRKGNYAWVAPAGILASVYMGWLLVWGANHLFDRGERLLSLILVALITYVGWMIYALCMVIIYGARSAQRVSIAGNRCTGFLYYGIRLNFLLEEVVSAERISSTYIRKLKTPISFGGSFYRVTLANGRTIYFAETMQGISEIVGWISSGGVRIKEQAE